MDGEIKAKIEMFDITIIYVGRGIFRVVVEKDNGEQYVHIIRDVEGEGEPTPEQVRDYILHGKKVIMSDVSQEDVAAAAIEEPVFKAMTPEQREAAEKKAEEDQAAADAANGVCVGCGS